MPNNLVTVDTRYGLAGLLALAEFDYSDEALLDPKWNPPKVKNRGRYEVEVELVPLGEDMTSDQVEAMVSKKDFRLALPEETLAHCARNKDLQREVPTLCLGAFWVDPGDYRDALVLSEDASKRNAYLGWDSPGRQWRRHYRVAVVRKSGA